MRKAGARDYKSYSLQILKKTNKPISFEVSDDEKGMIQQGEEIRKWEKIFMLKFQF